LELRANPGHSTLGLSQAQSLLCRIANLAGKENRAVFHFANKQQERTIQDKRVNSRTRFSGCWFH